MENRINPRKTIRAKSGNKMPRIATLNRKDNGRGCTAPVGRGNLLGLGGIELCRDSIGSSRTRRGGVPGCGSGPAVAECRTRVPDFSAGSGCTAVGFLCRLCSSEQTIQFCYRHASFKFDTTESEKLKKGGKSKSTSHVFSCTHHLIFKTDYVDKHIIYEQKKASFDVRGSWWKMCACALRIVQNISLPLI